MKPLYQPAEPETTVQNGITLFHAAVETTRSSRGPNKERIPKGQRYYQFEPHGSRTAAMSFAERWATAASASETSNDE